MKDLAAPVPDARPEQAGLVGLLPEEPRDERTDRSAAWSRRAAQRSASRAERSIALPQDVTWHRVHPVSPLLTGWKTITAVTAFLTVQNVDLLIDAWRAVAEHGVDLGHAAILWAVGGTTTVVLLTALLLWASWWRLTYAVDQDAVYLRSGVLVRQLRTARLPRIQSVDVVHPLLGRVLGLGQLNVEVAGGGDSHVLIGYLRTSELESLRDLILDLAAGAPVSDPATTLPPVGGDALTEPLTEEGATLDAPVVEQGEEARAGDGTAVGPAPGPLGFEDAVRGERITGLSREEHPLYAVDTRVLIGSVLRSGRTLSLILLPLIVIAAGVTATVLGDDGASVTWLASTVVGSLSALGMVWGSVNEGWGFRAAATPAGIRMRYGLTSDTSSTLPPGRVHGVSIEQDPLWRGPDWWRVEVCLAGRTKGEDSAAGSTESGANVLLPVGDRDTAERALWLVLPDLGTPDPDALLEAVLRGSGDDGVGDPQAPVGSAARGLIRVPRRGRVFSPLAWRFEGLVLTDTCVILRLGRFWRRTSVIPYERIQSLSVHEGPLARRRGLGKLHLDMVDTEVACSISNLDRGELAAVERVIAERALRRRREERLDRWLARVEGAETPVTVMGAR